MQMIVDAASGDVRIEGTPEEMAAFVFMQGKLMSIDAMAEFERSVRATLDSLEVCEEAE